EEMIALIEESTDRRSQSGYDGASKIQVSMILKRKEATLMILFVGLDVSSFDIKVCFLNSDCDQIKSFTVNNDVPGAMHLRDDILNTTKGQSIGVLRIGLESTSVYS